MTASAMISVAGLTVSFGSAERSIRAVDDVSFEVARGESYGLVGESGSGKSTIVRTLMGLNESSSGEIRIDGESLPRRGRPKAFYRLAQMVFQDPYGSLHPRQTVHRALSEPLAIHGLPRSERRIAQSLESVGLDPVLRFRYPHQLSGGQRQRVAIARALILEPTVLLLDEPTSALDVSVQAEILALFAEIRRQRQITLLLVTHNLAVVTQVCDRIAVMRSGRLEEELTSDQLRAGLATHPYTRELMAASQGFKKKSPTQRAQAVAAAGLGVRKR